MDKATDKKLIPERFLFLLFVAIFPLGQLASFKLSLSGRLVSIHLLDIIALLFIPLYIFRSYQSPKVLKDIKVFLLFLAFTLLISLGSFNTAAVFLGSFYLVRLTAYCLLYAILYSEIREKIILREIVYKLGLIALSATAFLGIIQYVFLPDLTLLRNIGWDDHLYRLAGTHLDPGFMGILMIFGFVASLSMYLKKKRVLNLVLASIFILAAALTYSRATYLSLLASVLYLLSSGSYKYIRKYIVYLLIAFAVFLPFLPRMAGEGVKLERTYSIHARIENYRQTWLLFARNPLFGIGYNNLCEANNKLFATLSTSHACGGSDSSILLILATSGTVGVIIFLYVLSKIKQSLSSNYYGKTFIASSIALLVHSQFVNSLFYPWVLGYMMMLLAISVKEKS
jgi:O-antigen ligase